MNERLNFRAERTETIWGEDGNAFPSQILLDGIPVLRPGTTWLSCRLSDGRRAVPYISERTIVEPVRHPGRLWINMDLLNWRDEAGNDIPDFRTDLRFELWDDGTAFVSFYFMGESCDVPDIESFTFEVRPDDRPLMQCRYCLRYELGYCVKQGGKRPQWKEPLFLRLGDGRRFRLDFDCKNCQMNVYAQ